MCEHTERLLHHARWAEEQQRVSFEASREFIHQYASTVHSRAKQLEAQGLSRDDAFRQAASEKNNVKLEKAD